MAANINLPRVLRVGGGASRELAATLGELELSRPFVITDPFMVECGYAARITDSLEEAGIACGVFSDCVPDPTRCECAGDHETGSSERLRDFERFPRSSSLEKRYEASFLCCSIE